MASINPRTAEGGSILFLFLKEGQLPEDTKLVRKITSQSQYFVILDGVLYFVDHMCSNRSRIVVPLSLSHSLIQEHHSGCLSGHFTAGKLNRTMSNHWWWERMYTDVFEYVKSCPHFSIVTGAGRKHKAPLVPIAVQRPFQVDIMEMSITTKGNRYTTVFQDFFSKWPMEYAAPDQKALRLVRLLVEEVIPFCGVPEALLSDRGANLLSFLMTDVCKSMGNKKLNTTSYHPQCVG